MKKLSEIEDVANKVADKDDNIIVLAPNLQEVMHLGGSIDEVDKTIVLTPLLQEALRLGGEIDWEEYFGEKTYSVGEEVDEDIEDGIIVISPIQKEILRDGGKIDWLRYFKNRISDNPSSLKLDYLTVNEDEAKIPHIHLITPDKMQYLAMVAEESKQAEEFREYKKELEGKRVLVCNIVDNAIAKVVKPSDASRYFNEGRRRIKGKIYKRLGSWFNCPGYLLSLTVDPSKMTRDEAWKKIGAMRREFMNRVNRWRKRHNLSKVKCLSVIEEQSGTGYPHIHLVAPYLRYLAPIVWMREQWGMASNSVNFQVKNSMSPVFYLCKYVSKLVGWSDVALSYIWVNRTRLYSMSRDYVLPDYSDKRVPEWCFRYVESKFEFERNLPLYKIRYHTILGLGGLNEPTISNLLG